MFPEQKDALTAAIVAFQGRSSTHVASLSTGVVQFSKQTGKGKQGAGGDDNT